VVDVKGVTKREPKWSNDAHEHDAWDPDWIENRFTAFAVCSNPACGEIAVVSGPSSVTEGYYEDHLGRAESDYLDRFSPMSFHPAPPVFRVPAECPETVKMQLERSFALIWFDPGSSANRMRAAAEALLDDLKIPKRVTTKKKKHRWLSLHERILKFQTVASEPADLLLAIKWVGNAGSHVSLESVTRNDVLDGLEIFEHVIELVYVKNSARIVKFARRINRRRGPVRPPKKRAGSTGIRSLI
jgi:hypothetical protein